MPNKALNEREELIEGFFNNLFSYKEIYKKFKQISSQLWKIILKI